MGAVGQGMERVAPFPTAQPQGTVHKSAATRCKLTDLALHCLRTCPLEADLS